MEDKEATTHKKIVRKLKRNIRRPVVAAEETIKSDSAPAEVKPIQTKKIDFSNDMSGKKLSDILSEQADMIDIRHPAIEYLYKWKNDRENWKFKKGKQTVLLQHLFDPRVLTKEDFKIMLEYLSDLKGVARDETLTYAKQIDSKIPLNIEGDDEESQRRRISKHRAIEVMALLKQ
ncbi:hypothetical protein WA158_002679 [Blastocystis sp. Blastoise]